MKILRTPLALLVLLFTACSESPNKTTPPPPVFAAANADSSGMMPKTLTGTFKGELPCKDCAGIQVILNLKDSSFSEIRNYKNARDKKHSMVADLGTCRQDSGLIHLINQQSVLTTYRIISRDSILFLDSSMTKAGKERPKAFLVKNGNF